MALMILAVITILYLGNFYLLAHEYLKEEVPQTTSVTIRFNRGFSLNDLSRNQMAEFVRQLQQLQSEKRADKVDWKHEGF